MKNIEDSVALVYDHGLFLSVAHRLAKKFRKVYYHSPWEEGFPDLNKCVIGDGFSDIERCDDVFSVMDEVDCWCFPDLLHSGFQRHLESLGKNVWGSRNGDSIELNRVKFHRILQECGLPVPKFVVIKGLSELRKHLDDKTDKYIKISRYRGTMETWHWRDKTLDSGKLDGLAVKLGPFQNHMPFLVVDPIECTIEDGGDTYCVDGKWPRFMLHGDEEKDRCYFSAVTPFNEMPRPLRDIMEAFSPVLKAERYRNQFSMETRDGRFIDPTMRGGLPSTPSQLLAWDNFPEIVWAGANGELVDPEPSVKFTTEAILELKTKKDEWGKIVVEGPVSDHCQFSCSCEVDGAICWPPDYKEGNDVGWLSAGGDTPEEAVKNIIELSKDLPDGLTAAVDDLAGLLSKIHEGEAEGVKMTDEIIPEPEIVIQ